MAVAPLPIEDESVNRPTKTDGFTLIELMITVVIIGILAAIAYPAYTESINKARRADGKTALLELQNRMEKFRGNCPFYPQGIGGADSCGASAAASTLKAGTTTSQGFYILSIVANSATGNAFTLRATPTGAQANDSCTQMNLVVNTTNPKGNKTGTGANCW